MNWMFENAFDFDKDIGNWDTGNVLQMYRMFLGAKSFNQDIGNWDTSNVEIMGSMFAYAETFNQKLSKWDTCSMTSNSSQWSFYAMFAESGLSKTNAEALIQQWGRNGDANKDLMFLGLSYENSTIGTLPNTVVITNGTPADNFFKAC
jgi:surface protein